MYKFKVVVLVGVLVAAVGIVTTYAQQSTSTNNNTSTISNPLNRPGVFTMYGVASGVSSEGFTLMTKGGTSVQVIFGSGAAIWIDGKAALPATLQNGMTGFATGQSDPSHATLIATIVRMNGVRYEGIISNLGTNSFSLVAMSTGTSTKTTNVSVGSGSVVIVNGDATSFASIENGMQASVYGLWTDNTMTAINTILVYANSAQFYGVMGNVGNGGFTLSRGAKSETINVGSNTVFSINERAGTIASVINGMQGTAYGTWTDTTRTAINAEVVNASHASISGRVAQVNGNQITVVNGSEKPFTVNVQPNATIVVNGFPSSIALIANAMSGSFNGTWPDSNESYLNAQTIVLGGTGSITSENGFCFDFNRNLKIQNEGNDVTNLQTALNHEGFNVDVSGYYDENTAAAVSGFQEKYHSEILTPNGLAFGTGYVGSATRKKLNQLYGCSERNKQSEQNIQSVRETMRSETPRNYQGTVSVMNGLSFTLTGSNGASYAVDVVANATVINRNWFTLSLSSIQNGDTVRVWGANASGTITAQIVRDVSIASVQRNAATPNSIQLPTGNNQGGH